MDDLRLLDFLWVLFVEFFGVMFFVMYGVGVGLYYEIFGMKFSSVYIVIEIGFFIVVIIIILSIVSGGYVNFVISIGFLVIGVIIFFRFLFYLGF